MSGVLLAVLATFLIYLITTLIQRWKAMQLREELGLRGPPADILTGNLKDILAYVRENGPDSGPQMHADFAEKYGRTFAFYSGTKLSIVSLDLDFAREFMIKQFSNFIDRSGSTLTTSFPLGEGLLQIGHQGLHGNNWKDIRSLVSPAFTTGKMKKMHPVIHKRVERFLENIGEKVDKGPFDCYQEWQALTLEVIAQCAFAMDTNCQRDHKDPFLVNSQAFFRDFAFDRSPAMLLSVIFPPLGYLLRYVADYSRSVRPLVAGLQKAVAERRKNFESFEGVDLIQLMLQQDQERHMNEKKPPLADETIVSNMFAMLIAGYETTSTALAYTTHLLAAYPDAQERLHEEIMEIFGQDGIVDYDRVMNAPYMDAVFHESLRLMPPVITLTARMCIKDTEINGIRIPRGVKVSVPVHTIQWSEENWPNARKFIPERFLDPATKKLPQWMPFGAGPRICAGMRFAEMEFKTALAETIRLYRFKLPPNGDKELKTILSTVLLRPLGGIFVEVERREAL